MKNIIKIILLTGRCIIIKIMSITSQSFRPVFRSSYTREKDLPKILGISLNALKEDYPNNQGYILCSLAKKLRQERSRGIQKRWGYDINRHMLLAQAYKHEKERFDKYTRSKRLKYSRLYTKN